MHIAHVLYYPACLCKSSGPKKIKKIKNWRQELKCELWAGIKFAVRPISGEQCVGGEEKVDNDVWRRQSAWSGYDSGTVNNI